MIDERDLNGNTTTIGSVSGGRQTITDAAGRAFTLTWSGGLITAVAEQAGGSSSARSVSYGYTGGYLTSVTDVNGGVTDFGYDTAGRLAVERSPRFASDGALPAAPTSCTATPPADSTGTVYETSGHVVCQWDPLGRKTALAYTIDGSGNITQSVITDPKGNETAYSYMEGVPVSVTKGFGTAGASTWSYIYDPVTGGIAFTMDPDGHATATGDDQYGDVVSVTDVLGRTTTTSYDPLGDPLTVTDGNGVTTTNVYDYLGNLQSSSTPLLDATGSPVLDGSTPVVSTTAFHHNDGHPEDITSKTDADGNTWAYTYDGPTGYLTSVTAPSTTDNAEHPGAAQSNETLYGFDPVKGWPTAVLTARGQQATRDTPSISLTCAPPAVGCTTYSYTDSAEPSGYNLFGRATVITDANGHMTKSHYDADGNLVSATDGDNNITITAYDAAQEPTVVTRAGGTTTRTDYNPDGTVADTVDGASNHTSYNYDAQARLTSTSTPPTASCGTGQSTPAPCTTLYGYDPAGNRVSKADPATGGASGTCPAWPISYPPTLSSSSACTVYQFDAANEPVGTFYSDGTTPNITSVTYDADGQRTSQTEAWPSGTKTSSWGYDSIHRLVSATDDNGATVGYGYTNAGLPQGQELAHEPTTIAYPSSAGTVTRTYDAEGRLASVTDWLGHTTPFAYTADSGVSGQEDPNQTTSSVTYDNADQVSSMSWAPNATPGAPFANFAYTRDNNSQVRSESGTTSHTYGYSPLNQLTGVDSSSYAYDHADNLTRLLNGATQSFDPANELNQSTLPIAPVAHGSASDPAGTAGTVTVTLSAPAQPNDQILVATGLPEGDSVTPPTMSINQWHRLGTYHNDGNSVVVFNYTATGGETSFLFTYPGAGPTRPEAKTLVAVDYRNVDPNNPIDASSASPGYTPSTNTTIPEPVPAPSVTTTTSGDRLVMVNDAASLTERGGDVRTAGANDRPGFRQRIPR